MWVVVMVDCIVVSVEEEEKRKELKGIGQDRRGRRRRGRR